MGLINTTVVLLSVETMNPTPSIKAALGKLEKAFAGFVNPDLRKEAWEMLDKLHSDIGQKHGFIINGGVFNGPFVPAVQEVPSASIPHDVRAIAANDGVLVGNPHPEEFNAAMTKLLGISEINHTASSMYGPDIEVAVLKYEDPFLKQAVEEAMERASKLEINPDWKNEYAKELVAIVSPMPLAAPEAGAEEKATDELEYRDLGQVPAQDEGSAAPGWPLEAEALVERDCRNKNMMVVSVNGKHCSMWKNKRFFKRGDRVKCKLAQGGGNPIYEPID